MKHILLLVIVMLVASVQIYAQSAWQTVNSAGVTLQYRTTQDGQNLECDMSAQTAGWVAVGFNQTDMMLDANIIIGYVSGGVTNIRDDFGNRTGSHSSDISLGGTNDVTLLSGEELAGRTTLRFTIPLSTSDAYDRPLTIGSSYPIILARGSNSADNYTGSHSGAGYANVSIMALPVTLQDDLGVEALFTLQGNYPNPFNSKTMIKFSADSYSPLYMKVYNTRGQLVYSRTVYPAGKGDAELEWPGTDNSGTKLSNGIYMLQLESNNAVRRHRMILSR